MRRTAACVCLALSAVHVAVIATVRMPTASAQPADPWSAAGIPVVTVHIATNKAGVRLEGRADENYQWLRMCDAPCDAKVPLEREYRVVGDGLRASSAFEIQAKAGDRVVLTVDPASGMAHTGGVVLGVVGGVAALIGVVILDFYYVMPALVGAGSTGSDSSRNAGFVVTLGGIAALVVGSIVMARSSESRISVTRPVHDGIGDLPSAPRAAMWNEIAPHATPVMPGARAAAGAPVFTVAF